MSKQEIKSQKMRGSADTSYLGKTVDEMIWEFMEEEKIEGLTLAIVQAPYIPRVVGYGFSDSGQKRLAAPNTMWPAGPISQAFTAVAIMQLYEDGKLKLEDSLGTYLQEVPNEWKEVNIIELLRHASGIADYRLEESFDTSRCWSFEELIALVESKPLKFAHGTDVELSATNFLLLTKIIERASEKTYHDFITERQINFLNLKHTGFAEDLENFNHEDVSLTEDIHQKFKMDKLYIDPTEYAVSYDSEGAKVPVVPSSALRGFSDIWASAQDISFWDIALAGGILIHDINNRALVYGPWKLPNGKTVPAVAGWQFYNHRGLMDIKGSVPGYSSFLSRFTDSAELVCVTLMANKEGIYFTNLARRIAGAFGDLLSTNYNDNNLYLVEGQFSVDEMVSRLELELKKRSIPLFAKFDHAQNAKEVGLNLRPTTVVVFGSPKVGTHLMEEDQSISLELPLRISIWEDKLGSTWVAFPHMKRMVSEYNISYCSTVSKIEKLLEDIALKVASVY